MKNNEEKDNKIKILENKYNELKKEIARFMINELNDIKKDKDEINLIYEVENEGNYNIFGEEFVKINKENIDLNINGKKNDLIDKYNLKKGENNIKMIIKNKITNLEKMFYKCNKLKNIDELNIL